MALKQISDWLKGYGGPIATVIVMFGALFAGVRYIVSSEVTDIRSDVATLKSTTATIDSKVDSTNHRIDDLLKGALERAFPKPSANSAEIRGSFGQADGVIRFARNEGIKLDPHLIESYGKQVAALHEIADLAPAQQTLKSLLDYRSFLNVDAQPQLPQPFWGELGDQDARYHFRFGNRNKTSRPKITAYGAVPQAQSAVLNFIGENINLERAMSPAFLVLDGDELMLDGMEMKNLVLRNVNIRYYGSLVVMENVYFVNCTFTFPPRSVMPIELKELLTKLNIPIEKPATDLQMNRQLLADKVLESPSVTLKAS